MKIVSIAAPGPGEEVALATVAQAVRSSGLQPQLAVVLYDAAHDDQRIHDRLRQLLPDTRLIGGTSFNGFMTEGGVSPAGSIGLLLIEDANGDFGVAGAPKGNDPAATAERLMREALDDASCSGQIPDAVWIYQAPGAEEQVLQGIRRVLQDSCPIYGGSSADNDVSGKWRQMGTMGPLPDAIVIAALFPSGAVGHAFQGGCEPTGQSGVVTQVADARGNSGGREIVSIDNQPAAQLYNSWLDGALTADLAGGGSILGKTTLHPLAINIEQPGEVPHHLLIHPESITPSGHLRTFCNVREGERLYAMRGNPGRLTDRAGSVAAYAVRQLDPGFQVHGALLIYCGGCCLAVGEEIGAVAAAARKSLGAIPYLCAFTFGEQGSLSGSNMHGNLMISAVVFGGD